MYRAMVRRGTRSSFAALSRGDLDDVLARVAPDVRHSFPGEGALGGERRTREGLRLWLERLLELCPPTFVVQRIAIAGPPWRTWVAVSWTAEVRPRGGPVYRNCGSQWLCLRWGRVVEISEHLGTDNAELALSRMQEMGIQKAAAPPIRS